MQSLANLQLRFRVHLEQTGGDSARRYAAGDPRGIEIASNAAATYERLGSPEGELALAQRGLRRVQQFFVTLDARLADGEVIYPARPLRANCPPRTAMRPASRSRCGLRNGSRVAPCRRTKAMCSAASKVTPRVALPQCMSLACGV